MLWLISCFLRLQGLTLVSGARARAFVPAEFFLLSVPTLVGVDTWQPWGVDYVYRCICIPVCALVPVNAA